MWFTGQKIVCIDDGGFPISRANGFATPVKDVVYTIREMIYYPHQDCMGLMLQEIRNPVIPRKGEITFRESKFRPVVEKKTDISIFTAMLKPADALV
jgi:hypothetical protein